MNDNVYKSYRIRTALGDEADKVINVPLTQTYDMFEILSLKLKQTNDYKYYNSSYGVIVGRVMVNNAVGVPNAKISIFIPIENEDYTDIRKAILYSYSTVQSTNYDGVRYNLLPDELDEICHANIGTLPNKRLLLDNSAVLEIFDKYYKYTTVSNESGDYMLYGIPIGSQQLHVDVDLSDIGNIFSQRPHDMIGKGYNANLFESPNKFKTSTNLNSLSQVYSQDKGLYVYSYWGESNENGDDVIGITRCDIQLDYKLEPSCVFMGSIVTDKGSNAIGKNCSATTNNGKMADLITGEGTIEMIRKTIDGKVEECPIMGNRLIDGDGVWCYKVPMNLDYVMTDEFGNLVASDNPERGIPTRARVRFRISMDESPNDSAARKRCKFLVPNNPRIEDEGFGKTLEADYEFGSATRDESFCDMFWNKVYTVKSYIPRIQKNGKVTNRKHTGIKMVNHYGDNNPFPYTNLSIKLSFTYRLICVLTKVIIYLIAFLNTILGVIGLPFCILCKALKKINKLPWPLNKIIGLIVSPIKIFACGIAEALSCIKLSSEFCDDGINRYTYYPGCVIPCMKSITKDKHNSDMKNVPDEDKTYPSFFSLLSVEDSTLITCIENSLAQENECTSFNFHNDWVNGVLYAPLWYRKITPKKSFLFGLFKRKAKDEWCSADQSFHIMRLLEPCALKREADTSQRYHNFNGEEIVPYYTKNDDCSKKKRCHSNALSQIQGMNGVIRTKTTMLGQTVYYYQAVEYDNNLPKNNKDSKHDGEVKLLFATDIVLLGSLNDCDLNGVPQFFKNLESSTFNIPTDILFTDNDVSLVTNEDGSLTSVLESATEMTGCDWGNTGPDQVGEPDGGLFYGIGCSTIEYLPKSCINLHRICEFGVSLDETKQVAKLNEIETNENAYDDLIADGFVSFDELYNLDERSMFATMNGNKLRTILNKNTGLLEYDFRYLYPNNFDNSLKENMSSRQRGKSISYKYNYELENYSRDYYMFRMGDRPYFYDIEKRFPRYENSFYFYFGLKNGKTAIEKFNSQYYSSCEDETAAMNTVIVDSVPNSWCSDDSPEERDGYLSIDVTGISTPYDIIIENIYDKSFENIVENGLNDEKIIVCNGDIPKDKADFVHIDQQMIPNGSYKLTITDSDGNITETQFSIKNKMIVFSTNSVNFKQPTNSLINDGKTYEEISKLGMTSYDNTLWIDNTFEYLRKDGKKNELGGTITIYNISCNYEEVTSYQVEVKPKNNSALDDFGISFNVVNNSIKGVKPANVCQFTRNLDYGEDNNKDVKGFIIGLPKGDEQYVVTLTEYCGDKPTHNVSSTVVSINEPLPFKLFINEIDYDLISHWNSGYSNSGNTNILKGNINNVSGWLQMSNKGLYNWLNDISVKRIYDDYNKLIKDYNLNNSLLLDDNKIKSEFTNLRNELDNTITDEDIREQIKSKLNEIEEYQEDIIKRVKEAFTISCPSDYKNLEITVQSEDYPTAYRIYGREEVQEDDVEYLVDNKGQFDLFDTTSVNDFLIPTISHKDSLLYGDSSASGPCFTMVNYMIDNLGYKKDDVKVIKQPYFVAGINGKQQTLPSTVGNNGDKLADGIKNYFAIHFIDKIFDINLLAWSAIQNIPKYGKANKGNFVNAFGFLTGFIYNGIPSSITEEDEIMFDEQTLDGRNLKIMRITTDEDAIPTKRLVVAGDNQGVCYENYKIEGNAKFGNKQYIDVLPLITSLTLSDNTCTIDEEIYGSMYISLNSFSIHDCKNESNILSVLANNSGADDTNPVHYYVVKINGDNEYPLNSFNNNPINSVNLNGKGTVSNFSVTDPLTIFGYNVNKDEYKGKSSLKGEIIVVYDNDTTSVSDADGNGWGTTGTFKPFKEEGKYYVIAVTGNNCRTISPVYDYTNFSVDMTLATVETLQVTGNTTESGSEETELITTYSIGVKINGTVPYYFDNFNATEIKLLCTPNEAINIEESKNNESLQGNNTLLFNIDEGKAKLLERYFGIFFKESLKKSTTIRVIDITGLTHVPTIKGVDKTSLYCITWDPNGGNFEDDSSLPIYEYHSKGVTRTVPMSKKDDGMVSIWFLLENYPSDSEFEDGTFDVSKRLIGGETNITVSSSEIYRAYYVKKYEFNCNPQDVELTFMEDSVKVDVTSLEYGAFCEYSVLSQPDWIENITLDEDKKSFTVRLKEEGDRQEGTIKLEQNSKEKPTLIINVVRNEIELE